MNSSFITSWPVFRAEYNQTDQSPKQVNGYTKSSGSSAATKFAVKLHVFGYTLYAKI